jgi:hypothetical protein
MCVHRTTNMLYFLFLEIFLLWFFFFFYKTQWINPLIFLILYFFITSL